MRNFLHYKWTVILYVFISLAEGSPFPLQFQHNSTGEDEPCYPGCNNRGECWEEMDICNCTSLYDGDHCESLAFSIRLLFFLLVALIIVTFIYCACQKKSTHKHRKLPTVPVADPFISSLDRIRDSDVVKQMWMGDKFQSRDSYLTSNQQRKDRWWKPKQKYSSVSVVETCNVYIKHIIQQYP